MMHRMVALRGELPLVQRVFCLVAVLLMAVFFSSGMAFADPVDPLGGDSSSDTSTSAPAQDSGDSGDSGNDGREPAPAPSPTDHGKATDQMRNYNPMQEYKDQSGIGAGILGIVGKATSFGMWLVFAFFFLVTVFDLAYINVPFTRSWLADANENGQGLALGGGGFGGGMGANDGSQKRSILNKQWVSDEAIQAVASLGGSAQSQTMGMGGMGAGMGMGMGGFGSMNTGAHPTQDANSKRTVMGEYLKKRMVVMILLGMAAVILLTSTLFGFGMDIGTWTLTVISWLVNHVTSLNPSDL